MNLSSKSLPLLGWFVTLLTPIVLALSVVRLLLFPAYLEIAYRLPGFPPDLYGFTFEERLHWARFGVEYLTNNAGIEYLADLRFPNGGQVPSFSCQYMDDCNKLYNARELEHMVDVKNLVVLTLWVWRIALIGLLALALWARFGGWLPHFLRALARGGRLTTLLTGVIGLSAALAFGVIFVAFHQIFFSEGTWSFYWTDTLIRLYPERFWRDIFLIVALLPAALGALLGWGIKKQGEF